MNASRLYMLPESERDALLDGMLALMEHMQHTPELTEEDCKRVFLAEVRKTGNAATIARIERSLAA